MKSQNIISFKGIKLFIVPIGLGLTYETVSRRILSSAVNSTRLWLFERCGNVGLDTTWIYMEPNRRLTKLLYSFSIAGMICLERSPTSVFFHVVQYSLIQPTNLLKKRSQSDDLWIIPTSVNHWQFLSSNSSFVTSFWKENV